jgi:hypothetical protein
MIQDATYATPHGGSFRESVEDDKSNAPKGPRFLGFRQPRRAASSFSADFFFSHFLSTIPCAPTWTPVPLCTHVRTRIMPMIYVQIITVPPRANVHAHSNPRFDVRPLPHIHTLVRTTALFSLPPSPL